jgi:hypothetical protein
MSEQSFLTADPAPEGDTVEVEAQTPAPPAADTPAPDGGVPEADKPVEGEEQQDVADGEAEGEEEAPQGAPEAYDDFTVAEGVELHQPTLEKFKDLAKAANLPQDKAQQFVDAAVELQASWLEGLAGAQQKAVEAWKQELKSDSEIGGDKLAPSLAVAKKALDLVRDVPGLTDLLDEGGLGNHPAIVKAFYRIGSAISEDTVVNEGTKGAQPPKALHELLYTNSTPKKG